MKNNDSYGSRKNVIRELSDSYTSIYEGFKYFKKLDKSETMIPGAAQWLLDNIYLIEKEYKSIKLSMPMDYFKGLPLDMSEDSDENPVPQIFKVAKDYIRDKGVIEENSCIDYINSIQVKYKAFSMGELWAFPLMLRIAIIMDLKGYVKELLEVQREILNGKKSAERVIDSINNNRLQEEIENIDEKYNKIEPVFLREFLKTLRDNSVEDDSIYNFVKLKWSLCEGFDEVVINSNIKEQLLEENISGYITYIRKINGINWRRIFEETSVVEKILVKDPENIYNKMDFESKDYYRHKIEHIAELININEVELANEILELSIKAKEDKEEAYKSHVGYYIIDEGTGELSGNYHSINDVISKGAYLSINILGTLALALLFIFLSQLLGTTYSKVQYIATLLVILIPINEIIIALTNWTVSKYVPIKLVPKIDYSSGIPESDKTVVVIPAIVDSKNRVNELMKQLEVAFCGNKDKNTYFALLSDFKDSKSEEYESDSEIIEAGIETAEFLNKKYFSESNSLNDKRFFFLSRKRIYNEKQGVYMAKERKRGKLMEFMALIRGGDEHTYNVISSDVSVLKSVKYLVTLDADTFMPRETVYKLVGAMSHVLNVPYRNENRVIRGYGIMQPKVSISIEAKNKTYFSRIFGGEGGVDGYSVAYSDTYQDLFGEGSFTGKGIINIDTFYEVLKPAIKDNKILSHDLLEGAIARCALVSNIEFIDGYPAYYESSAKRLHRWVRGDWQLIGWLFSKKIDALNKWKIFDNLRRSLLAPNLLLALILSITVMQGRSQIALLSFLAIIMPLVFTVTDFVVTPKNKLMGTFKSFEQILLILTFIPYQAFLMLNAIIKTLFRVCISKKNLLEWQTAADVEKKYSNSFLGYCKMMWISPVIGLILLYFSFFRSFGVLAYNMVVAVLWIVSPYVAYVISSNIIHKSDNLDDDDKGYLREISRKTWAYYEDFVNEENNYLAPDNYQERPYKGVAHRTSPTNIGMGLISNVVAYDLGYIHMGDLISRSEKIIESMKTLKKVNGHYLNWYDTKTKEPLWPRYVSTVDSGNLLGDLWVLKKALEEAKCRPIIRVNEIEALEDIYKIIEREDSSISIKFSSEIKIGEYLEILDEILVKLQGIKDNRGIEFNKDHKEQMYVESVLKSENKEVTYWIDKLIVEVKSKINYYNYIFSGVERLYSQEFLEGVPNIIELIHKSEDFKENYGDNFEEILGEKIRNFKAQSCRIDKLISDINMISDEMDFKFLYDKSQGLFSIGYNLEDESLGNSHYDLLASEARVASFVAIAKNDVPKSHWFKLSRAMTNAFNVHSLVSWSGTMFEYFMPSLIMKNYPKTLLAQTYKSVIKSQLTYGKQKKVPWGISESAFYDFDVQDNYQYKAFGIPGLGLKRGLEDELVISPYSTLMVLPFAKKVAIKNLRRLESLGAIGRYGFIESIDYTKAREDNYIIKDDLSKSSNEGVLETDVFKDGIKPNKVVTYMVHHLGMSFMALDNILMDNILINRFHDLPEVKATELLLKEKIPNNITFEREEDFRIKNKYFEGEVLIPRTFDNVDYENQEIVLLSNGTYSSMINLVGSGYSKKNDMMLYRWKGDSTSDDSGMFFYVKNLNSNEYWSATYEPCKYTGDGYNVELNLDKAKFNRKDGNIETQMEVTISPDENFEVRKITLNNLGSKGRSIEVTSYMEVTLAAFSADSVHPAFSNLFVQTEYNQQENVLIGSRRGRVKGAKIPYIFHKAVVNGEMEGSVTYETSRLNFIGRNRELKWPRAMDNGKALDNTIGTVLDPIMSLRIRVRLEAGEKKEIYYITGTCESKEDAIEICVENNDAAKLERVFNKYSIATQLELKNLGIKSAQANIFQKLASYIFFTHSGRQDREDYIKNISKHQKDLWAYGISGDLPIALVVVESEDDINLIITMTKLHYYLKIKGVKLDLIIYNNEEVSYDEPMQKNIMNIINTSNEAGSLNKSGGIFIHNKSTMSEEIKDLLIGISRIYVDSQKGSILNQMKAIENMNLNDILRNKEFLNEGLSLENLSRNMNLNPHEELSRHSNIHRLEEFSHNLKSSKIDVLEKEIVNKVITDVDDDLGISLSEKNKKVNYDEYDHDVDFIEKDDLVEALNDPDEDLESQRKELEEAYKKLDKENYLNSKNNIDYELLNGLSSENILKSDSENNLVDSNLINHESDKENLDFFNGYGGFSKEDSSYIIKLSNYKNTPAPWINVISNSDFGFHISESGSAYTWCGNSRENKITPWSNDFVKDPLGEALYIRDNISGKYFSISPKPVRDGGEYVIKHSFGYSEFRHTAYNIKGNLEVFAPRGEKVKIQRVILENLSDEDRDISVFYYARLVLGVYDYESSRYVSTYIEKDDGYIYGRNPYSEYFGKLNAFLAILGGNKLSFTGDRREFIGINGEISSPESLRYKRLSNRCGGIYDPCLAAEANIFLKKGEKKELLILFGEEEKGNIEKIINKYKIQGNAQTEFDNVKQYWSHFLGNIQVKTPDKSLDHLLNGWLLYQTLSCRYLSRTAFYQSGGAYGFRDQLQDSMALGVVEPEIPKAQILRSASRQYLEGDVQHWWHPVVNSGIRTRFSDDLLWLPYVTVEYINSTGDYNILDEKAPYLEDEPLREGEDERYTIVNQSSKEGTIYEHCLKAIEKALKFGIHNIPLMGSGDWNDGMSTVGNEGKGESIWLGWFLYSILENFIEIAKVRDDEQTKVYYSKQKEFIKENLEKNAWDGSWYRRAYFDDGTPLGSRENPECQIDSLAQSWSIISGAASKMRGIEAMKSVDKNLVKKDKGLILLLAPPFSNSKLEPGYIKGYVPGVRENGGQYTHAAVWVILALTKLGLGDKATKYYNMINPINHTKTELECMTYKLEPYVMAADVYIKEPHGGRGGWSWYTGASGWMYRVGIENILGLKKVKDQGYSINPCIPSDWNEYEIKIKNKSEDYTIKVIRKNKNEVKKDDTNTLDVNNVEPNNESDKKYKIESNSIEVFINGENVKNGLIPRNAGKLEAIVYI